LAGTFRSTERLSQPRYSSRWTQGSYRHRLIIKKERNEQRATRRTQKPRGALTRGRGIIIAEKKKGGG